MQKGGMNGKGRLMNEGLERCFVKGTSILPFVPLVFMLGESRRRPCNGLPPRVDFVIPNHPRQQPDSQEGQARLGQERR